MTQLAFQKRMNKTKKYFVLFLMMVPGLAYLIINNYLPLFGIIIAFKDYNYSQGIFRSEWIGLENFEYLFKTTDAYIITRNTILYNGGFIILNLIVGVSIAIFLNEIKNRFMSRFYQTAILMPYLISMIIVGYLVFALLSLETGFINKTILPWLGISDISWYSEAKYWPYILTIVHIWKSAGYLCVIFLATIVGIDNEYYEAAKLDGATTWQQIRTITIPLLMPVVTIMTLLQIGRIFYSDFGLFYQVPLNAGALQSTTNVIDTYVYRSLMTLGDIGMSSAAGLYQSIVGCVLVFISNYIVRKINKDNAMF
ncbi:MULTISPECIES: ABC transporter permease subunit [Paenibacillus]|uniref:ABC transporter permease n=1 Tax=Paenibacillus TaxID=44249 RepID=UPI00096CB184|nr:MULTISPECIES: ABC transporter permease subunit [Paenibacillus]OMF50038.1 sugar ABC transporter permease [Paenibacillus peoriae]QYK64849.1 putative multiple-sugar transport system permease YteP [Paenibacillus sp. S25]